MSHLKQSGRLSWTWPRLLGRLDKESHEPVVHRPCVLDERKVPTRRGLKCRARELRGEFSAGRNGDYHVLEAVNH